MTETLYVTATNCSGITTATVSQNHSSATANAIILCNSFTGEIGDAISINMGYASDHGVIFSGYVKQVENSVPDNTYTITAADKMTRAVDFFIAASNPANVLKYKNITAEDLVEDLMSKAGLTSFTYDTTYFTFAPRYEFEVSLVSSYDYSKVIADTITWALWCDAAGTVHFENRKPFVMTGSTGQPGDTTDERPIGQASGTITIPNTIQINYSKNERDLRNKVVVWGSDGIYAEAKEESPYLPDGFYKTTVAGLQSLIGDQSMAQNIADYNLNLLNRLTKTISLTMIGTHTIAARQILRVTNSLLGIDSNWYVYGCEHTIGNNGYTIGMELRQ
jgi:phage protein D